MRSMWKTTRLSDRRRKRPATATVAYEPRGIVRLPIGMPVCWSCSGQVSLLVGSEQNKSSLFGGALVKLADALKPFPSVAEIFLRQRKAVALGINGEVAPPKLCLCDGG